MTLCFSISGTSKEENVLSGGSQLGKLVEGVGMASSLNNSLAGSSGELKSSNLESLGNIEESDIVGDSANNGDDSGGKLGLSFGDDSAILTKVPCDSGDGDGVSVQTGLVESLVDDLVELGFGSSGEEGVKLRKFYGYFDQTLEVRVG
jgi:hypothetical protein